MRRVKSPRITASAAVSEGVPDAKSNLMGVDAEEDVLLSSLPPVHAHPLKIAFLHPDLGIGGAERLVVDAALALQQSGHEVCFFTSHHDPSHCFPETRDGTLPVRVYGDFLPRSLCGRFAALCAYVRSLYTALMLVLWGGRFDVVLADSISISIPILRAKTHKVRVSVDVYTVPSTGECVMEVPPIVKTGPLTALRMD
jgi:hypothetical protein